MPMMTNENHKILSLEGFTDHLTQSFQFTGEDSNAAIRYVICPTSRARATGTPTHGV